MDRMHVCMISVVSFTGFISFIQTSVGGINYVDPHISIMFIEINAPVQMLSP